ncbi:transposable element Tcb1 transposase [Trichonephila clavipes]|nr:transposable element Tcb1 transposase [Trichonephila clavipes]
MSFTQRPGSGRSQQTSHREDHHIVRNACVQPTASSAAIQAKVAPSETGLQRNNNVDLNDEPRFNLSSDDNRVGVWRSCGERLNPVFALQRHTTLTVGVREPFFNKTILGITWQVCLRTVTTLPWPARSPDLSPIEHIWDHLRWRVGHPTSFNELEARLQQIWNEISQNIIQNLYASMPDRIASCIHARGGSTRY